MEKKLKLSKEDLNEINADKARNQKQRMQFIDAYANWLKKMPNKEWSKHQNKLLNSQIKS
ncbi:MAG: hypothetical protein WCI04_03090 [archaeon]